MRTTIEIKPEHRAKLLEKASQRGEKGFSGLVEEALEAYFSDDVERERRAKLADKLKGSLSGEDAEEMRERIRELRSSWRDRS